MAAVPVIGSPINSLISDYQTGRKLVRLNELFEQLRDAFEANASLVESEYLTKDDFLDIFEETAKLVVSERSSLKRQAYKSILISSISQNDVDYDRTEEYLRLLGQLREPHLFFLMILKSPKDYDQKNGNLVGTGGGISISFSQIFKRLLPDWEEEDILTVLADLEDERLISSLYSNYKAMMTDKGINHLTGRLTSRGERFIKYCSDS